MGIAYGIMLQIDSVKGLQIMISSMPYYIIEVLALYLNVAVLFELNQVVRTKIKNGFTKTKVKISFRAKF